MNKTRTITLVIILGVMAVFFGFFIVPEQSEDSMLPEVVSEHITAIDLGITYLQVAPQWSTYYDIKVESGAMVTEVVPDSPAGQAGIIERE